MTDIVSAIQRDADNLRPVVAGFLLIQIAVGYEWLVSGLFKILNGGFPSGLRRDWGPRPA